jgi:glycosyltransferase EpsF
MTKRVLHISCDTLDNGGVQNVIMNICRNIPEVKFDIVVFSLSDSYYEKEFISLGGKVFRIPYYEGKNSFKKRLDYYIRFPKIFIGIYKILKQNGPYDVVHCHNYFESGICAFAARLAGVKVRISHCHNTAPPLKIKLLRRAYDFFLKKLIKYNANIKIGCSKQVLNYLFDDDKAAFVVKNAIDLKKFDREKYAPHYNNNINFIHIGRFCFQKNQLFLLDVFHNIKKRSENVILTMIGFGSDGDFINEEIINNKIGELELEDNVRLLPSDSDIPKLLSESDYFIFPSTYEGFGIVLLEAQAMGVKCFVSTKVPPEANMGLCEYLELEQGAEAWADYICKYIKQDKRDQRKSINDEVLRGFEISEVCNVYRKIYNMEHIR